MSNSTENKQKVNTPEKTIIQESIGDKSTKPHWMLNESINDNIWIYSKLGLDIPSSITPKSYNRISFNKKTSSTEHLTDKPNQNLLDDLKNSLLHIYTIEKTKRPKHLATILSSAINLIKHTNEIREHTRKPPIRSLNEIKFIDIESYLIAFSVDSSLFHKIINKIKRSHSSFSETTWNDIKTEFNLTTRELLSLKNKTREYLKSKKHLFSTASHYKTEYPNANTTEFEINISLFPKEKTISNEITILNNLFTSRSAQKYMFRHSPKSLFSTGKDLFPQIIPSGKTKAIPVDIALYALSSSLRFVRKYGTGLKEYIINLSKAESRSIKELNITSSLVCRNTSIIKRHAFDSTIIPESLHELNITSWEAEGFENIDHYDLRQGLSVGAAILLYIASIWILLASFSASRLTSLRTLKRNCFRLSPIDGLFDIVMRLPKQSELNELEDVFRPIPDLIHDYGLEFASFANSLEERQGYYADEGEAFLFGRILSLHSYDAFSHFGSDNVDPIYRYPLSRDSIHKALCFFQDWTKSPLIEGKRWYPSNHQFRRLFAILYFNFTDEEGLEELSWFMGHSNLEQTFHYAEQDPDSEWMDEAEATIARKGAILNNTIHGDKSISDIVNKARATSEVVLILEPLIRSMIDEHKSKTGEEVRFYRIENNDVFYYFHTPGEE